MHLDYTQIPLLFLKYDVFFFFLANKYDDSETIFKPVGPALLVTNKNHSWRIHIYLFNLPHPILTYSCIVTTHNH